MGSTPKYKWADEIERSFADLGMGHDSKGDGGASDPREAVTGEITRGGKPTNVKRAEGVNTTDDHTPHLDNEYVDTVVDLIANNSLWTAQLGFSTASRQGGKAAKATADGVVLQPGGENKKPTSEPYKDVWSHTKFQTEKLTGQLAITREDMRKAAEAGITMAEFILRRAAKIIANDFALLNLRGNSSIAVVDRETNLLSVNDGILKLTRDNSPHVLYPSVAEGKAWHLDLYDEMIDVFPDRFAHDDALAWFHSRSSDSALSRSFRNVNPLITGGSQGSPLGDRVLQMRVSPGIHGIIPTIVPQMPNDQNGQPGAVAPTAVSGAGGDVTATVTSLGAASSIAGRKVKVTMLTTGQSAIGTVFDDAGTDKVTITGSMGQGTISTTAGDYTIELADLTSVMLTNPGNFHVILYDKIRAYQRFDEEAERFVVTIHVEHDIVLHEPEAVVLQDGVISPRASYNA